MPESKAAAADWVDASSWLAGPAACVSPRNLWGGVSGCQVECSGAEDADISYEEGWSLAAAAKALAQDRNCKLSMEGVSKGSGCRSAPVSWPCCQKLNYE